MQVKEHYHHGALKKTLLAEALRELETDGLEGVSLRKVAETVGVSKTAPYRHFADKRELLVALAADGFRLLAEKLESVPPVGVEPGIEADRTLALRAVGPVPFRTTLQLAVDLPRAGRVQLEVFDVRGRRVRTLLERDAGAGTHSVQWDGRDERGRELGAGIYFVRMQSGGAERSLRVVRVQ